MKKFAYFRVADDNATAFPLDKLVDIRYNDATHIDLFFKGKIGKDSVDIAQITITSGEASSVTKNLVKAFANSRNALITVADSVDGKFAVADITAATSITLAS
jgi:hypothetical protein